MSQGPETESLSNCRDVRRRLRAGGDPGPAEAHLRNCPQCARERRLLDLQRTLLEMGAASEPFAPDEAFFVNLRARIARESGSFARSARTGEEWWPTLVWVTARQLIPIMAALLLLMVGATFLWRPGPAVREDAALRPSDRVLFNEVYDYPQPTPDDVLETLVAVEDKNGK